MDEVVAVAKEKDVIVWMVSRYKRSKRETERCLEGDATANSRRLRS